jgi:hypothetical protein
MVVCPSPTEVKLVSVENATAVVGKLQQPDTSVVLRGMPGVILGGLELVSGSYGGNPPPLSMVLPVRKANYSEDSYEMQSYFTDRWHQTNRENHLSFRLIRR